MQPVWEETLTLTVGNADADLVGKDHRVIQAAVDQVARLVGGTAKIKPGTCRPRNAGYPQSGVNLVGEGERSKNLALHPGSGSSGPRGGRGKHGGEIRL